MKKSKKIAIILAISATFGGVLSSPPERTYAADIIIDSQDKFNAIESDDAWKTTENNISPSDSLAGNTIIFKNITSKKSLIAGFGGSGNTNNNTIIVINSNVDTSEVPEAGSGADHIIGGFTGNDYNANNNTVILKDSKISAHIFGGDSHLGDACNNLVVIDNTEIGHNGKTYSIYGGYAYVPADKTKSERSGVANNNTIIIKNNSNLKNARLYGGYLTVTDETGTKDDPYKEEDFKKGNNTLILDDWSGSVIKARSFDNVNFNNITLSDFVNKTDEKAILTITGTDDYSSFKNIIGTDSDPIVGEDGTTSKDINIGLSFQGGQDINAGETIRLVQMNENGSAVVDTGAVVNGKKIDKIKLANDGTAYAGVAQVVKGELKFDEKNNKFIDYTIESVGLNDQVNVVNEGRAASAAFLNQSDELISEALAGLNLEDKYGFETFAMVYGNDSRYGTNSDLSINGWSGLVGVGSNNKTKAGDFAWAAFFENGAGNYDISTTMNGITMEGDGSTVYNGGGIAARLTGENGVYGEASLRAGLLKNDLEHGLQNQKGEAFGYESESNYYGMHIGIGKIFKLENGASVDTYAKYYHSTVKDDSFTIDGDEFEMDDINSDRLRLGIRYNQGMDRTFNVYYGAAWEYEFNGESNGYAQGHKMEETSLKGSTVIGELGVVIQPENSPWSFDAKVKGYGGQRDGYSGSILATYHF